MERNYREDQLNEVEALDSIYCGELEILTSDPLHKFRLQINTEDYNDTEENGLSCVLAFAYTAKYPDEAPLVEIEDAVNFEDGYTSGLLEHISETIAENLGIEMVFSLVSSAQEWLNLRWDEHKAVEENRQLAKVQAYEEAERKRFEGTRVSVETFITWRNEFEADTGILLRREKALANSSKLTGRELFMRDTTLNESDLKFLLEAGDSVENAVKVDESLFQNVDDLDLGSDEEVDDDEDDDDDDDEDDEDYVPGKKC